MLVFELYTYGNSHTGFIDTWRRSQPLHNAWTLIAHYGAASVSEWKYYHMSSHPHHHDEKFQFPLSRKLDGITRIRVHMVELGAAVETRLPTLLNIV
jgi:hypothetical protein